MEAAWEGGQECRNEREAMSLTGGERIRVRGRICVCQAVGARQWVPARGRFLIYEMGWSRLPAPGGCPII